MKSDDRIRAFLGFGKLKLTSSTGVEEEFVVKSIKTRDLGKILEVMSLGSDAESTDINKVMDVMTEVATDMLKRSFEDLDEDDIDNIIVNNFSSISDCIMGQVNTMTSNKSGVDKIKKKIKDTKKKRKRMDGEEK